MRTRIKFCGITRHVDAMQAVSLGVDALGFVFYAPSPRNIEIEQAADIIRQLPAFVTSVALFVNAEPAAVDQVIQLTQVDLLQFHGDESADECQRYGKPYIKAIRIRPESDLVAEADKYSNARALLLDTFKATTPGGTGETFDWTLVPDNLSIPVILAGGLLSTNVAQAIARVKPYAVDVSGGIESGKGIKDIDKMNAFVAEVKRVDASA